MSDADSVNQKDLGLAAKLSEQTIKIAVLEVTTKQVDTRIVTIEGIVRTLQDNWLVLKTYVGVAIAIAIGLGLTGAYLLSIFSGLGKELAALQGDVKNAQGLVQSMTDKAAKEAVAKYTFDGAVVAMNRTDCPAGWHAFEQGHGRYIVGLPIGGKLGGTQGFALSDLEDRPAGRHTHLYQDDSIGSGSRFTVDGGSPPHGLVTRATDSNPQVEPADPKSPKQEPAVKGTNAPYIQLLLCEQDLAKR